MDANFGMIDGPSMKSAFHKVKRIVAGEVCRQLSLAKHRLTLLCGKDARYRLVAVSRLSRLGPGERRSVGQLFAELRCDTDHPQSAHDHYRCPAGSTSSWATSSRLRLNCWASRCHSMTGGRLWRCRGTCVLDMPSISDVDPMRHSCSV